MSDKAWLKNASKLAWASSIGLVLVISTAVGLGIGVFLDRQLDTSPWLTIFFLLIGIAAGFWNILKEVIKSGTKAQSKDSNQNKDEAQSKIS